MPLLLMYINDNPRFSGCKFFSILCFFLQVTVYEVSLRNLWIVRSCAYTSCFKDCNSSELAASIFSGVPPICFF